MQNIFGEYLQSISSKFSHEDTSEMGYRGDFESLINGVFESMKGIRVAHDPRVVLKNKPDFIVLKGDIPILYIEAKDIGVSLDKVEKSEQMARYFGYTNLVLTDYVEFRFYRNGVRYEEPIKIAEYDLKNRTIKPLPDTYEHARKTLLDFTQSFREPIKSGQHLSKIMGGKAQRIRDNIRHFLDKDSGHNEEIMKVYEVIKRMLVHDLTLEAFADMYAQTLVYGLFVARYYDESPDTFSRQEARDLVPASNPFLQHFFDHIAGSNFDKRLSYIVDELCEVFQHSNTKELMDEYMADADPVIHFYEDFLKEYDPELRKRMGAYYTPLPIVRFIVRSVDQVLREQFNLSSGLADTSKLPNGKHRVQILDPAVGTGTFISATIRSIYERLDQQGQSGRWPTYVHNDLLPRLHGFELMMAPYTIAHLKLSLAFKQTGFWKFHRRLGIYLTNSLEESTSRDDLFSSLGFAESIAEEAKEADKIKNETPIMVVIGNPPYSVSSSNKGEWIQSLIKDYKKDLGERKINLDDDYIKFIRFAEHFVEKNKVGIVAMITNNSYIDGITHRQMRKHLLETFDEIYILDLHGNSKKKEKAPDGEKDENVFDIQQGVSISILVRKNEIKEKLGAVYHSELFGKRDVKFEELNKLNISTIKWKQLSYSQPYYFFVPKDFRMEEEYEKGIKISELFMISNSGVKTDRDTLFIDMNKTELERRMQKLLTNDYDSNFKIKYRVMDSDSYKLTEKLKGKLFDNRYIQLIQYRPFDYQWIYYDPTIISRSGYKVFSHFHLNKKNIGLVLMRTIVGSDIFNTVQISNSFIDLNYYGFQTYIFPLYLYSENGTSTPNFNTKIIDAIEKIIGKINSESIFDYIYAVLYSPNYRKKYKEFLKIDFPRVPYPKDPKSFKKLVELGNELRLLHLLESPKVNKFITIFPASGSNTVEKISYKDGKVFFNAEQYFGNVPEVAWNFYIGGYQPAQKWLKDRKGRVLTNEDIEYYQKMIVALTETDRIMKEIDKVNNNND